MSTHSVLGVEMPDGSISACYVHFDGDSMESRIDDFVDKNTTTALFTLIKQAQNHGGIRGFHCPRWPSEDIDDSETDFLDDNESYVIDEANFFDDHMGTFAWYLVDYETGEIEKKDKY